ncbi:uncharacterized protein LOC128961271 [Oppia nitens]|uniref:uncharacterized protein LOC128961271 n=1 Tax=Oppia nitens TaxID=1686743 RepID=UPI0023DA4302|nr:uncharacterized protein LOC128961271 [Oppia nitens]
MDTISGDNNTNTNTAAAEDNNNDNNRRYSSISALMTTTGCHKCCCGPTGPTSQVIIAAGHQKDGSGGNSIGGDHHYNNSNNYSPPLTTIDGMTAAMAAATIGGDNNSGTNDKSAVSLLQELCAKHGLPMPTYDEMARMGSCHDPIFTFRCQILLTAGSEPIAANAIGKTKQMAKRRAAEEVTKLLQQRDYSLIPTNNSQQKKKCKHISQQTIDPNIDQQKECKEYIDFVESLELQSLEKLFEAKDTDYCLRLNLIAEKLNCFANYITITDDSTQSSSTTSSANTNNNNNKLTNRFKCLLQVKRNSAALTRRLPVFVSWGNSSVSTEQAMQIAAQRAIVMVKVLKCQM